MSTNERDQFGSNPKIISTQGERIALSEEIKEALLRDLFDLIAIDTSNPPGKELEAAELVRARMGSLGAICSLQRFSAERANAICRIPFPGVEEGPCPIFTVARRNRRLVALVLNAEGVSGQPVPLQKKDS
jgi:acetylornithine deacetylase/succinyl-diaminopimelate desuccinylase-like protein